MGSGQGGVRQRPRRSPIGGRIPRHRGEDKAGQAILFVKDNGMGIAPQYHNTVFELFHRLDQGIEGTGIGLAIVKRIIETHGGRIWVESAVGEGTTFCFTLPIEDIV